MRRHPEATLRFLVLFTLFAAISAHAATVNAASSSLAAVQSAINNAVSGDVVLVPAGSSTWSGSVTIPDSKKITLQGAGMGSTTITASGIGGYLIELGFSGSRVTGFTLANGTIRTAGIGWRVDHCAIGCTSAYIDAVMVQGSTTTHPTGLVDHCNMTNARVLVFGGWAGGYMQSKGEHAIWNTPLGLGTNNAPFVEDCTFVGTINRNMDAFDANHAGRIVFRHNTVTDMFLSNHGPQEAGNRGARSWEIYNNTMIKTGGITFDTAFRLRSGTGVVFNNTLTGAWVADTIGIDLPRANWGGDFNGAHPPGCAYGITSTGLTFTSSTKTISASAGTWAVNLSDAVGEFGFHIGDVVQIAGSASNDGRYTIAAVTTTSIQVNETLVNEAAGSTIHINMPWDGVNGYPARDQPGAAMDTGLATGDLYAYSSTFYPQTIDPMYEWNNTRNGTAIHYNVITVNGTQNSFLLQAGRDFINNTPRPGYSPYTYPHPLIQQWGGSSGGSSAPNAPTGLRVRN